MKKLNWEWAAVPVALLLCVVVMAQLFCAGSDQTQNCFVPQRFDGVRLVLDAGHGGEDGGAISVTGTCESGINLSIALKMQQLCGFFGINAQLTRDGDYSLHDRKAVTLSQMKRTDLMNRVELIESGEPTVLISIHQNCFTSSRDHGAQVFYAPTQSSDTWGAYCQQLMIQQLEPENHRQSKQISKDIYLMNHITCPALLVECGFLSNREEAAKLETDDYQKKLSIVILDSYITYSFST